MQVLDDVMDTITPDGAIVETYEFFCRSCGEYDYVDVPTISSDDTSRHR